RPLHRVMRHDAPRRAALDPRPPRPSPRPPERPLPLVDPAPPPPAHIHLMGICGTAMGAFAGMLKDAGYVVTGSDTAAYPPMSDYLASLGIEVMQGYTAANLDPRPDLVVVGNVIRAEYEEAVALRELDLPYTSMPA